MEHAAVDVVEKHGIDPKRILGMRWILTWKPVMDDEGVQTGRKAKARLIIKGFEDPDLLKISRDSPTLSTFGRNMLLTQASMRNWTLQVGDIKTAFLNSDDTEVERQIFGEPPPDAKQLLGVPETKLFRIRKAIYGLLNAPRRWMDKLSRVLREDGWLQCKLEPCLWRLFHDGQLTGLIGVHVDDILCCGAGCKYEDQVKLLREQFNFGSWKNAKKESITYCGCEMRQEPSGQISLNQERFAFGIHEIELSRDRKSQEDLEATEAEKTRMKGVLGALAWRVTQTAPWLAASTSILQGYNKDASVKELLMTNKLVRLQRCHAETGLTFSPDIKNPLVLTYTDASHANRADLSSQGGSLTLLTDECILEGKPAPFSVLAWHSRKLRRTARSSTCAEVQACANAYDDVEFVKQLLFDLEHEQGISSYNSDHQIAGIPSAVVCDAKNLYDAVTRIASSGLQLEEKRLCLDVITIKERAKSINAVLRWVDSNQEMADDLTKMFAVDKLIETLTRGRIKITFDSQFLSAKKKRQMNLS